MLLDVLCLLLILRRASCWSCSYVRKGHFYFECKNKTDPTEYKSKSNHKNQRGNTTVKDNGADSEQKQRWNLPAFDGVLAAEFRALNRLADAPEVVWPG